MIGIGTPSSQSRMPRPMGPSLQPDSRMDIADGWVWFPAGQREALRASNAAPSPPGTISRPAAGACAAKWPGPGWLMDAAPHARCQAHDVVGFVCIPMLPGSFGLHAAGLLHFSSRARPSPIGGSDWMLLRRARLPARLGSFGFRPRGQLLRELCVWLGSFWSIGFTRGSQVNRSTNRWSRRVRLVPLGSFEFSGRWVRSVCAAPWARSLRGIARSLGSFGFWRCRVRLEPAHL